MSLNFAGMKLVDLSHPLRHGQPGFPGDPHLEIAPHCTIDGPARCNVSNIRLGSHQGTHLDALSHFLPGGRTLDQMPLDWFFGPAFVAHIPKAANETITVEDFAPYRHQLVPGARMIYATGWAAQFGQANFFTEFPTLALDAARYLADSGLRLLGMDTPTPSREAYESHHILLGADIVIVESLTNLQELPHQFHLATFPLNFAGLDGSPVRAVAFVEENP